MKVLMVSQNRKISYCKTHSHACYELVVVTKGECTTVIDNNSYEMKKGTVLIIPPYIKHEVYSKNCFSDIFIQYEDNHPFAVSPLKVDDYSDNITKIADVIKNIFINNGTGSSKICSDLLKVIFDYISTMHNESYSKSFVPILKNIIIENLSNSSFNICNTILELGYNQDYVTKIFKLNIGMTPGAYLTYIRIEQAKRLLLNNDYYTIKQISFLCGFSDQYYFSRLFKKKVGCSPSKYKENL